MNNKILINELNKNNFKELNNQLEEFFKIKEQFQEIKNLFEEKEKSLIENLRKSKIQTIGIEKLNIKITLANYKPEKDYKAMTDLLDNKEDYFKIETTQKVIIDKEKIDNSNLEPIFKPVKNSLRFSPLKEIEG